MLDIIAGGDMDKIQGMLNKIFDGITRLGFNEQSAIAQMISKEKEVVTMSKSVKVNASVEVYMKEVENIMKGTVFRKLNEGNKSYD